MPSPRTLKRHQHRLVMSRVLVMHGQLWYAPNAPGRYEDDHRRLQCGPRNAMGHLLQLPPQSCPHCGP
eukprot:9822721-Karenia_brevis.AAC.1